MPTPLVSVVIPVYNAEETITRCLESIKAQTWTTLQIICVDDYSTDRSHARIADCIASDSRCTLLPPSPLQHENLGPAAARNAGIRQATGDLLYFIDADDWVEPCAIETLVRCYQDHAVGMVCGGHVQNKDSGVRVFKNSGLGCDTRLTSRDLIEYVRDYLRVPYHYVLPVHCWNKLYEVCLIQTHGILFDTRLTQLEDVHFNFRYLRHVEAVFFSGSFHYHHCIASGRASLSSDAGTESDAVQKCVLAFAPIGNFLDCMDGNGVIERDRELGHHFVTTAVIYIVRLVRRFMKRPSVRDYRNIEAWIASSVFSNAICHYRRQRGESRVVAFALRTRRVPIILIAVMYRELALRLKISRGG